MGEASTSKARSPRRRLLRLVSAAAYLLAAAWLIHLAVSRWNGVPADPTPINLSTGQLPPAPIDPQLDRTQELFAALAAMPPVPDIVLPTPPAGMRWSWSYAGMMSADGALYGEWTPDVRPNLQCLIEYVQSPAVEQALARLAAIRPGGCRAGGVGRGSFREAVTLLIARSRFRREALQQVDAALDDLDAVFHLSAILRCSGDSIDMLTSLVCKDLAAWELCRLAHETLLTNEEAARAAANFLRRDQSDGFSWNAIATDACDALERVLDQTYSDDGGGNGWLVLSRLDDLPSARSAVEPRCGVWNILSPIFNDRRTVAAKIKSLRVLCERIGGSSYADANRQVEALKAHPVLAMTDGPLFFVNHELTPSFWHRYVVRNAALREAVMASISLSAYRRDHGEYPAGLDSLLHGYLAAIPNDPYVDRPLRYVRGQDRQDYVLYSVGPNQTDDGGKGREDSPPGKPAGQQDDLVYSRPRLPTRYEPTLEKVAP